MDRLSWVYIMTSHSRVLYTGVTTNLEQRVLQHRMGTTPGFTSKYRVDQLVHVEEYSDIRIAISREKQIKGWSRAKKIALIEKTNPEWRDLAASLPRKVR